MILTNVQLAEGKIRLAMQRVATKYPFHAAVLDRFVLATHASVTTMGVSVFGERVHLWYCPDFVVRLPLKQLAAVLLHEINHVIFKHICMDPVDYPDDWALTIATEVTVNEFVAEPLPPGCILLDQFPKLPPGESTDQRYRRLVRVTKRPPIEISSPVNSRHAKGPASVKRRGDSTLLVPDDHRLWADSSGSDGAKDAVQELLSDAATAVEIPENLRDLLDKMGIVSSPGSAQDKLESRNGKLSWKQLLRKYVGQSLVVRADFRRPPRRLPHLVGIVPGRRRRSIRPTILAVIDTSASMTNDLLEQIRGELSRLALDYTITVVECDVAIQRVYPFRSLNVVLGRGGTDLRPPFETAFLRKHRTDLVIYFTDGDGPAPEKPPFVPVIWCLTPDGVVPASWGSAIRMEDFPAVNLEFLIKAL